MNQLGLLIHPNYSFYLQYCFYSNSTALNLKTGPVGSKRIRYCRWWLVKWKHPEVKGRWIRFLKYLRCFKILNHYQVASSQPVSPEARWAKSHCVGNQGVMAGVGNRDWRLHGCWDGAASESGQPQIYSQELNPAVFQRTMMSANSDRAEWTAEHLGSPGGYLKSGYGGPEPGVQRATRAFSLPEEMLVWASRNNSRWPQCKVAKQWTGVQ